MIAPSRPLAAVLLVLGSIIAAFGAIQPMHGAGVSFAVGAHLVIGAALLLAGGLVLGRAP